MEKQRAINVISKRIGAKSMGGLKWAELNGALGDLSPSEKDQLLGALRRENAEAVGAHLIRQVREWLRDQAVVEATAMLEDDVISLDELDKVL